MEGGYNMEKMTSPEKELKKTDEIANSLDENIRILEERMGLNHSFDVVMREMTFAGYRSGIFYLNGLVKEDVLTEVIKRLTYLDEKQVESEPLQAFMDAFISHIQVTKVDKMSDVVGKVLTGATALFINQETNVILIDAKNFPVRSIQEPDLERVVRGSRDGFIETLLTNVSLVRRRIRDPRLKLEILQVGERTQMDVCIAYIQDIADPGLVKSIQDKIKALKVDGIPLAEKQLEEAIVNKGWNPYPSVRFSERPDVISTHLLEGHVTIFVDTSPSVMIMPSTFFHLVQHAEENRQTPFVGTYLRWVRFAGILASLFILPLWYLMVVHPELKPVGLEWIGPQKPGKLPLLLQFLIAELGIDLMRMAAVHTPSPLTTAMGLVAAILIGDIAVKTGMFANEIILYLAIATIGTYATPSYELGLANRIFRVALLIITAIFTVPGFVVATTLWFLLLALDRSYNAPYLWPFIPFNGRALIEILIRRPFLTMKTRLSITKPIDNTRQE
jgi:stage V sporulation protein AF